MQLLVNCVISGDFSLVCASFMNEQSAQAAVVKLKYAVTAPSGNLGSVLVCVNSQPVSLKQLYDPKKPCLQFFLPT